VNTLHVNPEGLAIDLVNATRVTDVVASALLDDDVCLSRLERPPGRQALAHVSECRDDSCPVPGSVDCAVDRNAEGDKSTSTRSHNRLSAGPPIELAQRLPATSPKSMPSTWTRGGVERA
jgi:hypothetical protein